MKPWLILLNNFLHDLFTGLWFGSFITLYVLRYNTAEITPAPVWLNDLNMFFFVFCIASLGLIGASGTFRFFYYRDWDGGAYDDAHLKKQMLAVKHAVLGTSFVGGTVLSFVWVF